MASYWHFMHRPPSQVLASAMDHFGEKIIWEYFAAYSVFFCVLCALIPRLGNLLFPKFVASLSERKRGEYPTYAACLVHHLAVVPFSVLHIYWDLQRSESESAYHNYASTEAFILTVTFGYMVGDILFFALGESLRGEFEFLIHHILSIGLVVTVMYLPGPTTRFISHVLLCELSQLFFVAAWFLRLFQCQWTGLITALEATFALMFIITRNINLPFATWRILDLCGDKYLNTMRALMWPIVALQFYWLSKILKGIIGMVKPAKGDKKQ